MRWFDPEDRSEAVITAAAHVTSGHGTSRPPVLPEVCVQNGVRHLIAELVGMTGTDRFRRDQSDVFLVHDDFSPFQS